MRLVSLDRVKGESIVKATEDTDVDGLITANVNLDKEVGTSDKLGTVADGLESVILGTSLFLNGSLNVVSNLSCGIIRGLNITETTDHVWNLNVCAKSGSRVVNKTSRCLQL
eukprot:TRINITY_DN2559_c0_g1_i1.p2 TRINITY_DN2559_c0_g1~~TRINITY_DN2559_c0_g1_i1.p2  ORF type:complete len:112 (-),score=12.84 TRINITY_DN2559_c0_g1_i1:111-446(-)